MIKKRASNNEKELRRFKKINPRWKFEIDIALPTDGSNSARRVAQTS